MLAPATSLIGTVLDDKFQIEQALASGAAGDVYEAIHLTLGSRVAVKVLRSGASSTSEVRRLRFLREARLAAGIQSDHVVRVFDFAAHENGPTYLVMELLQGETLASRIRRTGQLAIAEAVDYVVQAATPLAVLHESGIIHRDVKPSNLFLARDSDRKERIKLLDFGVAAFRSPIAEHEISLTLNRAMIGTPRYMAPEQVRSSGLVDARADVWALGVTLYELLAGRPPFDAKSVLAVLKQIERKIPAPLRKQRPAVPAKLAAIVHGCLAKDRERRPANARALLGALEPLRETLAEVEEEHAGAHVDRIDLSLHDPDVEVLRPVRLVKWRRVATAAAVVCGLAMSALIARRPSQAAPESASNPVARNGASPRSAPLPAFDAISATSEVSSQSENAPTVPAVATQPAMAPDGPSARRMIEPAPRPYSPVRHSMSRPAATRYAPPKPPAARAATANDEPLE